MSPMRIQRIMMSIILFLGLVLMNSGHEWGEYLIGFVAVMAFIAGVTGFCPSDVILMKLTGKQSMCER